MRDKNSLDTSKYIPIAVVTGHGIRKSERQKGILQCYYVCQRVKQNRILNLPWLSPPWSVCVFDKQCWIKHITSVNKSTSDWVRLQGVEI